MASRYILEFKMSKVIIYFIYLIDVWCREMGSTLKLNLYNLNPQTAEALNEHIRQIENETKVVEVMKSFPNDELVSFNSL